VEADGVDVVPVTVPGSFVDIGQRYSVLANMSQDVEDYLMRYLFLFPRAPYPMA